MLYLTGSEPRRGVPGTVTREQEDGRKSMYECCYIYIYNNNHKPNHKHNNIFLQKLILLIITY